MPGPAKAVVGFTLMQVTLCWSMLLQEKSPGYGEQAACHRGTLFTLHPNQIKAMSGCTKGQLGESLHCSGSVSRNSSGEHKVCPSPETPSEMSSSCVVLAPQRKGSICLDTQGLNDTQK